MDLSEKQYFTHQTTYRRLQEAPHFFSKISLNQSTPSPIFLTKSTSLNQSQINSFIPPVSPTSKSYSSHQLQQAKLLSESQTVESKTPTKTKQHSDEKPNNYPKINPKLSKIPQFYFPTHGTSEAQEKEESLLSKIFSAKNDVLSLEEFSAISVDILGFPIMLNRVLFNKIDTEKTGKISKSTYLKYIQSY